MNASENPDFVKATQCPVCGYKADSATVIDGEGRPQPNDLTLCLHCGEICTFSNTLDLLRADLNALMELPAASRNKLFRAQDLIRRYRAMQR